MLKYFWNSKKVECQDKKLSEIKDSKQKVLVIGAGMIGLASAYYLSKFGNYQVTVVEKRLPNKRCF